MRILLASSEVHPYSKTGGLADMVGSLAKTLGHRGHQAGVVTPLYAGIRERFPGLKRLELPLEFPMGPRLVSGEVWYLEPSPGVTVYFVDQPTFYDRAGLYQHEGANYPDNAERFTFFSKAAAHLALHLPWQPEVLHLHDWQASLAAPLLRHQTKLAGQGTAPGICLTIHNMAYQGLFPAAQYALTNLPWDYFTPEGVEFYGQLNCLKAGIVYADRITTVSPRYAREITTEELGCGLDGLLRRRADSLVGILNGVDYEEWNTISDPYLANPYSAADLSGKAANKLALQKEFGLPVDAGIPLFGSVGRLAEQKGVEIMLGALEEMLGANLQFVMIGSGAPAFQKAYQDLARRFPSQVGIHIGFDEGLSHRIEAGSDFFLMPSRFEPCGLNQMYGLRYGTIPIVRTTGGLDDTVIDPRDDAGKANGIKFSEYSSTALAKGIRKALALYEDEESLKQFRVDAMAADFSWDRTVEEYIRVYEAARRQHQIPPNRQQAIRRAG
jgi:starch synthase